MRIKASFSIALILTLLISIIPAGVSAQDSLETLRNYHHFTRLGYQFGTILKTNSFVKGENATWEPIDSYHAARIEFGWQSTGSEEWMTIWNYPTFGLGFYGVDFFNEDELGNPLALYGFTQLPISRSDHIDFNILLADHPHVQIWRWC